jgi:hypothetical protein
MPDDFVTTWCSKEETFTKYHKHMYMFACMYLYEYFTFVYV